jgi:putative selenium metabolism protein SsnA
MLFRSARLLHLDPPGLETADLRIEEDRIAEKGVGLAPRPGEPIHDLPAHRVILPGLVLGHHHLYSSLARGMPPPSASPRNFEEILSFIWWRLDQALDGDLVYHSALTGAAEAAASGVTTIIDHHASPNAIEGSLDRIREALDQIGLRGVLGYEVTDRHGVEGREQGLGENDRFLREWRGPRFAGLVGAHAAFTLSDDGLSACARVAETNRCGVHIHVAEDPCDDAISRSRYGRPVMDRLEATGILRAGTLLCHGTHLGAADVERAKEAGCRFAHCPRSNMNNGVGYAPVGAMRGAALLGTDGISGDLFEELRAAWFKSRDAHTGLSPAELVDLLAESARLASERLGVPLGRLEPGAAADLTILDYRSPTPLTSENVVGHLLFGLGRRHVWQMWVGGRRVVDEGQVIGVLPDRLERDSQAAARRLWERMARIEG